MDVSGFQMHMNKAAKGQNILLLDMQYELKLYKSWSAVNDEQSEFVNFLQDVAAAD
jgi:hypothetical protein